MAALMPHPGSRPAMGDDHSHGGTRPMNLRSRAVLAALLALALLGPARGGAGDLGTAGLLWRPEAASPHAPLAVVVALHDTTGIDQRGWVYGEQLTAAGIAVLHAELLDTSQDGYGPVTEPDPGTEARARLAMLLGRLAADPRFADSPVGLLAFGGVGQTALHALADSAVGERIAALALLYPGCAALAPAGRTRPHAPVLLLHGDADPSNRPEECGWLEARLAQSAPVRRREYAGAGYAWDRPPHGPGEAVKLPWPGSPGRLVAVHHQPRAAELAAAHVAAFFADSFATHAR